MQNIKNKEGVSIKGTRGGYRIIEIEGQMYIWSEEDNRIEKRRNF